MPMNSAERLALAIEDAGNPSIEAIEAMAGDIGHHGVRYFANEGKRFLAFRFSADESEFVMLAPDDADADLSNAIHFLTEYHKLRRAGKFAEAATEWQQYQAAISDFEYRTAGE